jgi:hypothetical protein
MPKYRLAKQATKKDTKKGKKIRKHTILHYQGISIDRRRIEKRKQKKRKEDESQIQ